jgi:hypothetical protein
MRTPEGERMRGMEEIFEAIITENSPQINVRNKPHIQVAQRIPRKKSFPPKKVSYSSCRKSKR